MKHVRLNKCILCFLLLQIIFAAFTPLLAAPAEPLTSPLTSAIDASIAFRLPVNGPLPATYRVTLAITDRKNPNWIISQFVAGQPFTVTTQNKGRFTVTWNGLDDNFMPVPPGEYAVKGIYMPTALWMADGAYHTITVKYLSGASSWDPTAKDDPRPEPFGGDPVGEPLRDIDVGTNGHAVFYWQYLENGRNNPVFDLNKPIGIDQFVTAYGSGGAAGGGSVCTDGISVWCASEDGGPKFVYRADGKPFGTDSGLYRSNVYRPEGWVRALACRTNPASSTTFVYVAQGGRITGADFHESQTDYIDKVTVLRGGDGAVVGDISVSRPIGIVARYGQLTLLHQAADGRYEVVEAPLNGTGMPTGALKPLFSLPPSIIPADIEVDSHGRFYISDPVANKVYLFNADGTIRGAIGRLTSQVPGEYDPLTLINPHKLAVWTDSSDLDYLLVVEDGGPNRVTEWKPNGAFIRQFLPLQTKSNDGYAIDPDNPSDIYLAGQSGWLDRFKLNYHDGSWTIDAVWPNVGTDPISPGFDHPKFIRMNGHEYLVCTRSRNIYIHDGNAWRLSAAIVSVNAPGSAPRIFVWHDVNGTGKIEAADYEKNPLRMPGQLLRYHGENVASDMTWLAPNQAGPNVWELKPTGFDTLGDPIYGQWAKMLTDPVFVARSSGKADAVHGGNELASSFDSDWAEATRSSKGDIYIMARGGYSFSANQGSQEKLTRYTQVSSGGYSLKWRTGRATLVGDASPGQIYGAIHLDNPINGIVPVIDQSRCGVVLYTTAGLYVDTLFADGRTADPTTAGIYVQPGEFFAGITYLNKENGRIYVGLGKYTPLIFQVQGWSQTLNPVKRIEDIQSSVLLTALQTASAPDTAVFVRGGSSAAKQAIFLPAVGGVTMDGSMEGWENADTIIFQSDPKHTVEVRCLYDPSRIYLRWHLRVGHQFSPTELRPIERIFTHDRASDTMSFYLQGDPDAKPGSYNGRVGDTRVVFGVFKDDSGKAVPVALGMHPLWTRKGVPITYHSMVGKATFENVSPVLGAMLNYVVDSDGQGYVLAASLPLSAFPSLPEPGGDLKTQVDFEATLGGHNKFWWANSDGSASSETYDEPTEARLYPGAWAPARFVGLNKGLAISRWLICGPFGGPGAQKFSADPQGPMKDEVRSFYEKAVYPPDSASIKESDMFSGAIVKGYWPDQIAAWRSQPVDPLDGRVVLGTGGQLWYGAVWLHVDSDTAVDAELLGHEQTEIDWFLNDTLVKKTYDQMSTTNPIMLKSGWNKLEFRGYCVGYPPFRAGLILHGAPADIWRTRLSYSPPK